MIGSFMTPWALDLIEWPSWCWWRHASVCMCVRVWVCMCTHVYVRALYWERDNRFSWTVADKIEETKLRMSCAGVSKMHRRQDFWVQTKCSAIKIFLTEFWCVVYSVNVVRKLDKDCFWLSFSETWYIDGIWIFFVSWNLNLHGK